MHPRLDAVCLESRWSGHCPRLRSVFLHSPQQRPSKIFFFKAHGGDLNARVLRQIRCLPSMDEREMEFDEGEMEALWRSVPKPLMTIGKQGIQKSHQNAFSGLLMKHKLIKVKHLFHISGEELQEVVARESNGYFLTSKGNVLLFASNDAEKSEIQEWAEIELKKIEGKKSRREEIKELKKLPPSGVVFPERVKQHLKSMEDKKRICSITFDTRSKMLLNALPEDDQMEILTSMSVQKLERARNKSAWLTSQIKVYQEQQKVKPQAMDP